jgi:hypothetical protein
MNQPSMKLVHALIGKSIIEALLIGALAIYFFFSITPPLFRGWGEVNQQGIGGWVVNRQSPYERVEVQLYIDGIFVSDAVANQYRPDVRAAGWAEDDWSGFSFTLPHLTSGIHEARLFARYQTKDGVRQILQLVGDPLTFSIDEKGQPISQKK